MKLLAYLLLSGLLTSAAVNNPQNGFEKQNEKKQKKIDDANIGGQGQENEVTNCNLGSIDFG